jgi:hypothetical protein
MKTDYPFYFMVGASHLDSSNGRDVRDNSRPITETQAPSFKATTSTTYRDEHGDSEAAIDPLSHVRISLDPSIASWADCVASQQILKRTNTQHKKPQALYASVSVEAASGAPESDPSAARLSSEPAPVLRRVTDGSVGNKLTKDKEKK